jgi:hypothetical protein
MKSRGTFEQPPVDVGNGAAPVLPQDPGWLIGILRTTVALLPTPRLHQPADVTLDNRDDAMTKEE